jgi:hypothetical protein
MRVTLSLETGHTNRLDEDYKKTGQTPHGFKPYDVAVLLRWPFELLVDDLKRLTGLPVPPFPNQK